MSLKPPRPANAPLNALRAFEAAARHGSFLRAADELSVTPGAVAQQIKKLEDWAGVRLFERHRHGVTLTALGARLLPRLTQGLDVLGEVAQSLRHAAERPEIRIAALPAIAQLWLGPRLSALRTAIPNSSLTIHALETPPMPGRGDFDLSIYPEPMFTDQQQNLIVLARNHLLPVAAPDIAGRIEKPEQLSAETLIHDLAWRDDWSNWLKAQGWSNVDAPSGSAHSLYSIAVDRCIAGDGVLIGHTALVQSHIDSGALSTVFPGRSVAWHPICLRVDAAYAGNPAIAAIVTTLGGSVGCTT